MIATQIPAGRFVIVDATADAGNHAGLHLFLVLPRFIEREAERLRAMEAGQAFRRASRSALIEQNDVGDRAQQLQVPKFAVGRPSIDIRVPRSAEQIDDRRFGMRGSAGDHPEADRDQTAFWIRPVLGHEQHAAFGWNTIHVRAADLAFDKRRVVQDQGLRLDPRRRACAGRSGFRESGCAAGDRQGREHCDASCEAWMLDSPHRKSPFAKYQVDRTMLVRRDRKGFASSKSPAPNSGSNAT